MTGLPTSTIAEINLSALCDNYRLLAGESSAAACAAVVKADAYGLGAAPVATALWNSGCQHFFTATMAEAANLRAVLPDAVIGVFYGVANDEDVQMALAHDLIPCLSAPEQVARWKAAANQHKRVLPAALHIDTGMTRLGLSHHEAEALVADTEGLQGIAVQLVMSHLACASTPDHPLNAQQLERFRAACALFPEVPASFANSSGVFMGEEYHFDLLRPGAAMYGINPTPDEDNPMQPVVTIRAPILQIRTLTQAETIGYGGTYQAPTGSRLATIAGGYADGLLRAMGNYADAWVNGHKVPMAGIVSMDLTVLDISSLREGEVQVGDWVELVGPHMPLDVMATKARTIGYELLTSIGSRVPRIYHQD